VEASLVVMEADDHQDDEIKESMSETEDEKDVKVSAHRYIKRGRRKVIGDGR